MTSRQSQIGTDPNTLVHVIIISFTSSLITTLILFLEKFSTEVAQKTWERVKVVCTQPFSDKHPIGLSYFWINAKNKHSTTNNDSKKINNNNNNTDTSKQANKLKNEETSSKVEGNVEEEVAQTTAIKRENSLLIQKLKNEQKKKKEAEQEEIFKLDAEDTLEDIKTDKTPNTKLKKTPSKIEKQASTPKAEPESDEEQPKPQAKPKKDTKEQEKGKQASKGKQDNKEQEKKGSKSSILVRTEL